MIHNNNNHIIQKGTHASEPTIQPGFFYCHSIIFHDSYSCNVYQARAGFLSGSYSFTLREKKNVSGAEDPVEKKLYVGFLFWNRKNSERKGMFTFTLSYYQHPFFSWAGSCIYVYKLAHVTKAVITTYHGKEKLKKEAGDISPKIFMFGNTFFLDCEYWVHNPIFIQFFVPLQKRKKACRFIFFHSFLFVQWLISAVFFTEVTYIF